MGRTAKAWRIIWKRGWAYVRFTWSGVDVRHALWTQDPGTAAHDGAIHYAKVVSGELAISTSRQRPGQLLDLANALDAWIESKRPTLDHESVSMLETYARTYVDFFASLDNLTEVTCEDFGTHRLGRALRTTVLRERAYLVQFLEWCKPRGYIQQVPHVPKLPPKAQGIRTGTHRAKAVRITKAEAVAIIKLLPAESKTIDGRKWPLQKRFDFMRLTGFRPETISRLSVPENWTRGASHVELTNEDDKARYGRDVDIVPDARRILMECAPEKGTIFGRHVFYKALKRAAALVLDPARAKDFAPYDLRHHFARDLLDRGAKVRGVSYQLGHKRVSTTDKYLAPDRQAGAEALRAKNQRTRTKPAPARKGRSR